MFPADPVFQHFPLPCVLWDGLPDPGPQLNQAFARTFRPEVVPFVLHRPDGTSTVRLSLRSGEHHLCRVRSSTLPTQTRLIVIEDVQADHQDVLTGLEDRRALRLESEALQSGSLALLDIDGFKLVNDALGHAAGDEVLRELAGVLSAVARGWGARAFRLGGDEFVLLGALSLDAVPLGIVQAEFARRMTELGVATCGVSWGLARAPEDGRLVRELLEHADTRLLAWKASRRSGLAAQFIRLQRAPGFLAPRGASCLAGAEDA